MWILLTLFLTITSGVVGYLFGAQIAKHIFTALGRPYFRTTFSRGSEPGEATVDAQFNSLFIYELERVYKSKGDNTILDPMAPENEKIAVYMYDVIGNIAENYLPPEGMPEEIDEGVPMLGYRGGEEVKQIVDLGKEARKSNIDIVG